jgi:hypothetical protein
VGYFSHPLYTSLFIFLLTSLPCLEQRWQISL